MSFNRVMFEYVLYLIVAGLLAVTAAALLTGAA